MLSYCDVDPALVLLCRSGEGSWWQIQISLISSLVTYLDTIRFAVLVFLIPSASAFIAKSLHGGDGARTICLYY